MATITHLFTFPLKSGAGAGHRALAVSPAGAALDRAFCVRDNATGAMVSARDVARLTNISCSIQDRLIVFADTVSGSTISCSAEQFDTPCHVKIWSRLCPAMAGTERLNSWISERLDRRVSLCRRVEQDADFFDTSPLHLINADSVRELGDFLGRPIPLEVFRANIVVEGLAPLSENTLCTLIVDGVRLEVLDECDRCSMIDTVAASLLGEQPGSDDSVLEALRYLKDNGRLSFGLYLRAVNAGTLRTGATAVPTVRR
jgi:uncharacterized protein YcbX